MFDFGSDAYDYVESDSFDYDVGWTGAVEVYAYDDGVEWRTAESWGIQEHARGLSDGSDFVIGLTGFVPRILAVVFMFFFQVASVSVLGVSALDIVALLFTLAVALIVIRFFVK